MAKASPRASAKLPKAPAPKARTKRRSRVTNAPATQTPAATAKRAVRPVARAAAKAKSNVKVTTGGTATLRKRPRKPAAAEPSMLSKMTSAVGDAIPIVVEAVKSAADKGEKLVGQVMAATGMTSPERTKRAGRSSKAS